MTRILQTWVCGLCVQVAQDKKPQQSSHIPPLSFSKACHKSPAQGTLFSVGPGQDCGRSISDSDSREKALKARKSAGLKQNSEQLMPQVLKNEQGKSRAAKQRGMGLCRNGNENKDTG